MASESIEPRRPRHRARAVAQLLALIGLMAALSLAPCREAAATNFVLSPFVDVTKEKLKEVFPNFISSFPNARFRTSGFTSASGEWQFIRAEDASICKGDVCPTILIQRAIDWKVLVYATKEITVSINYEQGEFVQCDFQSTDGKTVSVRYSLGERIVIIPQ